MAYAIAVQADVIDIRSSPPAPDRVFVDTNVWFWYAYPRASLSNYPPLPYQKTVYPGFLRTVFAANSQPYHSGLELAELNHLIEKTEREAYNNLMNCQLGTKEFRHGYPIQRRRVVTEVASAWAQVEQASKPIDCTINPTMTRGALTRFSTLPLDGYDLFFVESLLQSRITTNVLTDDGDFATIPGITLYTANNQAIQDATRVGKLIVP